VFSDCVLKWGFKKEDMAMRMLLFGVCLLGLVAGSARGEPYWIAYEGDVFPEEAGWQRHWGDEHGPLGPGAERRIEDGVFVLDSLRHDQIFDFYDVQRSIDPGPGETFVAEWRMRVDEQSDLGDASVGISRDAYPGYVQFYFGDDAVLSVTDGMLFAIEPGVFHTYRFVSPDMLQFEFFIDGMLTHQGAFEDFTLVQSSVGFGDTVQGRRSLSYWDYFCFGVVPEPGSGLSVLALLVVFGSRRGGLHIERV
jgi:hypothetical protein